MREPDNRSNSLLTSGEPCRDWMRLSAPWGLEGGLRVGTISGLVGPKIAKMSGSGSGIPPLPGVLCDDAVSGR